MGGKRTNREPYSTSIDRDLRISIQYMAAAHGRCQNNQVEEAPRGLLKKYADDHEVCEYHLPDNLREGAKPKIPEQLIDRLEGLPPENSNTSKKVIDFCMRDEKLGKTLENN